MANTSKTFLFDVNGSGGPTFASPSISTAIGSRVAVYDANKILGSADYSPGAVCVALWTKTASTAIANTTVETTLLDTGVGSKTLTANFLTVGKSVRFEISGFYSTLVSPTLQFKFKLGSVVVLDSGAITAAAGAANQAFSVWGMLTCRSTGAPGTVFAQGSLLLGGLTTPIFGIVNTGTATVDTTGTLAMDTTITWGTANALDTLTATDGIIEGLG